MRRINVTNKRPKKTGAIYREEQVEQRRADKKNAEKKRKTERLVWVTERTQTAAKDGETDEECRVRYRLNHRNDYGLDVY